MPLMNITSRYPDGVLLHQPTGELSRLVTAAVVNQTFRHLLLTNPALALVNGYNGEPFRLAPDVQAWILSIQASSLADFATQVTKGLNGNGNGHNGHNGH